MSESLNLDDEIMLSPDMFSEDQEFTLDSPLTPNFDESYPGPSDISEPEPVDESQEWKGVSLDDIYKGLGPYGHQQHLPIRPSECHTVLFRLPIPNRGPPKPYPTQRVDKWSVDYVRMPNSPQSLYPVKQDEKSRGFRMRWNVIQEALLQSFMSSTQLEAAIFSYNNKYVERWDFRALHHFFNEVIDEEEATMFFNGLLPKMVQLALQLPILITGPIPLLKRHSNKSISFSQLQVASLIANAFFCTFPRRNSTNPQSEYANYPYINFNRLFSAYKDKKLNRSASVMEKLKCIFHYFRRVTTTGPVAPEGTITIQRCYIPRENCPNWSEIHEPLPPLHITNKGTIETEGAGLLQVDFANRSVGGGALFWGCVQEEIRFVICPELIATILVSEILDDTEALIISGIERYSDYEGYSDTFTWTGDFVDDTPWDNSGRRKTSVVAIDATRYNQPLKQFMTHNITRELNKAFVGFSSFEMPKNNLPGIATGNWGCGAFRGDPKLKALIQLMAAGANRRPVVYYTFNDKTLRDTIAEMYWYLVNRDIDIGHLFSLFQAYGNEPMGKHKSAPHSDFYQFLYNQIKIKPLKHYFKPISSEKPDPVLTVAPLKILPETSKKLFSEKVIKTENRFVGNAISPEEDEQRTIRNLLEECEMETEISTKKTVESNNIIEEKEEKRSLWDTLAAKESEMDKIKSNFPEKHLSGLDLLEVKSDNISAVQSDILLSKNRSPSKLSNKHRSGQKTILDFFSRKT